MISDSDSTQMSDSLKVSKAREFKADGNEAYKSKNYRQAIGKYHRALLHLKGIGQNKQSIIAMMAGEDEDKTHPIPPEMISEVGSLQADCYNNLAACLLQQDDPNLNKVVDYCDNVLAVQPGNVKAIYRKGQALYNMKNFEKALCVFSQAKEDPSVKKYINLCKRELEKQEKELRSAYKGMFSKLSGETTSS